MGSYLRTAIPGRTLCGLLFFLCLWFAPGPVLAGEFRVTPIKLVFDRNTKSGAITVINEGKERITLQTSAAEWTQDEKGKDVYSETTDIVFHPKIMTLEASEQRVIRAGSKGPTPVREKTYRLFIEEIPEQKKSGEARTQIAIVIRFAPPIFVRPAVESSSGVIEKAELSRGRLTAVVRNTGNVHCTITSVTARGEAAGREIFSKEISGWYLLAGASRSYETAVPPEACAKTTSIRVDVKTDRFDLSRTVNVLPEMCRP